MRTPRSKKYKYKQVADRLSEMIRKGAIKPGQRVPSIRAMARQMAVGVTTVIEAYRLLEDRRLIESRPQSGFYALDPEIAQRPANSAPPEPEIRRLSLKPTSVRVWSCLHSRIEVVGPEIVLPGAAIPAPQFLPIEQLNRICARILRTQPARSTQYEFPPGYAGLRAVIARRAFDAGCNLGPDDIVITNGATEALMLALRAVTSSGDAVAIESPCYFGTLHLLEELRLRSIELPTDPRAGVSVQAIERLAAQRGKVAAVVLNPTVHNPLGSVMPDEKKRRIAEVLSKKRIPLIEDDACGDLAYDEPRPKCIKTFDAIENVMLCGSFSKTIAPGYRVGWIAPGKWREEIVRLKQAYSLASTTVMQLAIAQYLDGRQFDRHLKRIRKTYREQMRLLKDAVGRYFPEGTKATNPAGWNVLWVELPPAVDTVELYEKALKKGVAYAPGAIFSPTIRYRNCLRLHAALPWCGRIEKAIETLGKLVSREVRTSTVVPFNRP